MCSSLPCCVRKPPSAAPEEPCPGGRGSKSTTSRAPRRASARATEAPATPPPSTAITSARAAGSRQDADQPAAVLRHQLRGAVERRLGDGQVVEPERTLGAGGDLRARRVRAGVTARPGGVGQAEAARDADALLADAGVDLA